MTAETMTEQVERVAGARRAWAVKNAEMTAAFAAFQEQQRPLTTEVLALRTDVGQAERQLRELALAQYAVTGEKRPVRGVEVKVRTAFKYAAEKALEWAQAHGIAIVPAKLDGKTFERVIAAMPARPAWIVASEEPFCTIATELDKVLLAVAE